MRKKIVVELTFENGSFSASVTDDEGGGICQDTDADQVRNLVAVVLEDNLQRLLA